MSTILMPPLTFVGKAYPNAEDIATLVVEGEVHQGWKSLEISTSLEEACRSFGFAASVRWPGQPHAIKIQPWQEAQVWIGSDLVVNGYIDAPESGHDATSHDVQATGRSRTQDIVDCSAVDVGPSFKNQTNVQIARALAAPYGVEVECDVDAGDPIPRFVLEPGETPYAAIERLARLRQFLVTDTPEGALLLTRAGTDYATGAIRCEAAPDVIMVNGVPTLDRHGNVLAARARFDGSKRYSEYVCRGQSVLSDAVQGKAGMAVRGSCTDDMPPRRRVLRVQAEGPADAASCEARATWEAATRAGQSVSYECTVQGWRQTLGGPLWQVNQLVEVVDNIIGLRAELLVVSCRYTLDSGGTRCAMRLAPQQGYLPEPPRKAGKGTTKVGAFAEISGTAATATRPAP